MHEFWHWMMRNPLEETVSRLEEEAGQLKAEKECLQAECDRLRVENEKFRAEAKKEMKSRPKKSPIGRQTWSGGLRQRLEQVTSSYEEKK